MRPIDDEGSSTLKKRCQRLSLNAVAASCRSGGYRDHRMIEAERHVPRLRGEYREDAGAFDAQQASRKQRDESGDGDRQEAQHRDRLQDVEHRQHHDPRPRILRGDVAPGEREQQRRAEGNEHAQHGARRVVRDQRDVERELGRMEFVELDAHVAAQHHDGPEQREHAQDDHDVDPAEAPAALDLLAGGRGIGAGIHREAIAADPDIVTRRLGAGRSRRRRRTARRLQPRPSGEMAPRVRR